MVDTAVQTVGEVAARLAWPHYQQLLGHFLKAMQRLGEANKVRSLTFSACSHLPYRPFKTVAVRSPRQDFMLLAIPDSRNLPSLEDLE